MKRKLDIANRVGVAIGFWIGALATACGVFAQAPGPRASTTQTAAATGQVSGTIQDSNGNPVHQATVAVLSRFQANPSTPFQPFAVRVNTDQNGRFTATGVPAGKFAICPNAAGSGLLSPCLWESEPTVTLAPGQSVAMQPIQLKAGADLYVRVNDPHGTFAAMNGKVAGASLFLAVRLPNGILAHIPVTASDSAGFDNHLPVPASTNLTLVAFSNTYKLTDANNTPISQQPGLSQSISVSATQTQYSTAINIQ